MKALMGMLKNFISESQMISGYQRHNFLLSIGQVYDIYWGEKNDFIMENEQMFGVYLS